jgi:hypothetical protein
MTTAQTKFLPRSKRTNDKQTCIHTFKHAKPVPFQDKDDKGNELKLVELEAVLRLFGLTVVAYTHPSSFHACILWFVQR